MTSHRTRAYFYLLLVSIIWGVATPVIKYTLGGISPLPFLTYRFSISAILAVLAILFFERKHLKNIFANFWEAGIYSFITTTFALGVLFIGLEKTTVLDAALIAAVGPLVTAVAGAIFLREVITRREKLGIAIAFSGTLITVFEPLFNGGLKDIQLTGNFLVVGYIVIMSASSVLSKRLVRKNVDPLTLTNFSFIIGFLTLLPFTLSQTGLGELSTQVVNLPANYHLGVWYMALLSGTAAYALWVRGQKSIEISEAGLFAYLMPLFSTPLGVFWLGEKITPPFIVGGLLIATGVIIAEIKKKRD